MPFRKRVLFNPDAYHNKDVFEDTGPDTYLQDTSVSKLIGAMNQLSYLSCYALEIFQNIAVLTEDVNERIKMASSRTQNLYDNLKHVERQVTAIDTEAHFSGISGMAAFLASREMFTPQMFNKSTNYTAVSQQYKICRPPPQLWRIEMFTTEDCFKRYSNPGYFFQAWVRSEIMKQQKNKEEKKKNKAIKKQMKMERKKLREAALEAAMLEAQQQYEEEVQQQQQMSTAASLSGASVLTGRTANDSAVDDEEKRPKSRFAALFGGGRGRGKAADEEKPTPAEIEIGDHTMGEGGGREGDDDHYDGGNGGANSKRGSVLSKSESTSMRILNVDQSGYIAGDQASSSSSANNIAKPLPPPPPPPISSHSSYPGGHTVSASVGVLGQMKNRNTGTGPAGAPATITSSYIADLASATHARRRSVNNGVIGAGGGGEALGGAMQTLVTKDLDRYNNNSDNNYTNEPRTHNVEGEEDGAPPIIEAAAGGGRGGQLPTAAGYHSSNTSLPGDRASSPPPLSSSSSPAVVGAVALGQNADTTNTNEHMDLGALALAMPMSQVHIKRNKAPIAMKIGNKILSAGTTKPSASDDIVGTMGATTTAGGRITSDSSFRNDGNSSATGKSTGTAAGGQTSNNKNSSNSKSQRGRSGSDDRPATTANAPGVSSKMLIRKSITVDSIAAANATVRRMSIGNRSGEEIAIYDNDASSYADATTGRGVAESSSGTAGRRISSTGNSNRRVSSHLSSEFTSRRQSSPAAAIPGSGGGSTGASVSARGRKDSLRHRTGSEEAESSAILGSSQARRNSLLSKLQGEVLMDVAGDVPQKAAHRKSFLGDVDDGSEDEEKGEDEGGNDDDLPSLPDDDVNGEDSLPDDDDLPFEDAQEFGDDPPFYGSDVDEGDDAMIDPPESPSDGPDDDAVGDDEDLEPPPAIEDVDDAVDGALENEPEGDDDEPSDPPDDDEFDDDGPSVSLSSGGGRGRGGPPPPPPPLPPPSSRINDDNDHNLEDDYDSKASSGGGSSKQSKMSKRGSRSSVSGVGGRNRPPPPPPPPPPVQQQPQPHSALSDNVLGALKSAGKSNLKSTASSAPAAAAANMDPRSLMMKSIQLGASNLKSVDTRPQQRTVAPAIDVKQNEAVAAILANRSKIAGSDSESSDDDSDSEFTDDDY